MSCVIERRPKRYNWRGAWYEPGNPEPWRVYRRLRKSDGHQLLRRLEARGDGYEYRARGGQKSR